VDQPDHELGGTFPAAESRADAVVLGRAHAVLLGAEHIVKNEDESTAHRARYRRWRVEPITRHESEV